MDWPALPYANWRDTALTLQLWTQIVGKVRLALTPWLNHGWHVPLYVTARGLGTSPIPFGGELLEIEFDFIGHRLVAWTSRGEERALSLEPRTVADVHDRLMAMLAELGVEVAINPMPNEVPDPVAFPDDRTHASYDAGAAHAFWRALILVDRVFRRFRSGFLGKASPVHFFWGSFDLAVTRFSGRAAPLHPGGVPGLPDGVTREAYSHEVSSAGFWPGSEAYPHAAFYSYAYPEPPGFRDRPVTPGAGFDAGLGEYVMPYETVRAATDPDALLIDFLETTYAAAADCGGWDRGALECPLGTLGAAPRGAMTLLLGISGSLRKASFNAGLLRAAEASLPDGTRIEIASIADIPLYNADVEAADGIPPAVAALKEAIVRADGLLLATPEYNNGIPGVFKNVIDWTSRPPADIPRLFAGKPVAVIGASPGGFGTILAQAAWLPVLRTLGAQMWTGGRLMVPGAGKAFDGDGNLADEKMRERLAKFVAGFVTSIAAG